MTQQPTPPVPTPAPTPPVPAGLPPIVHDIIVATLLIAQIVSAILVMFLHRDIGINGTVAAYMPLFTAGVVLAYGVYMALRHRGSTSNGALIAELMNVVKAVSEMVPMATAMATQARTSALAATAAEHRAEGHRMAAERALAEARAVAAQPLPRKRVAKKTTAARRR